MKSSGPMRAGRRAAGAAALSLFCACEPLPKLSADAAALGATAPSMATAAPDCASCHAYPLHDVMHQYHLNADNVRIHTQDSSLNNMVTCMDCHFRSIQSFSFAHPDTVWGDAQGNPVMQRSPGDKVLEIHAYRGWRPLPHLPADTAQGRFLAAKIDSLISQYARIGKHAQWRTGWAHENGSVEVAFAPNDVNPADSLAAAYRPRDLSCSSIACHNSSSATYRFRDPIRGLPGCPSFGGNEPTCGETPAPVAKRSGL